MSKTKTMATGILFAMTFGAVSAWAGLPSFDELDRDGNGYISASEATALPCLAENFNRIETESDEGLNRSEFEQAVDDYCHSGDAKRS